MHYVNNITESFCIFGNTCVMILSVPKNLHIIDILKSVVNAIESENIIKKKEKPINNLNHVMITLIK